MLAHLHDEIGLESIILPVQTSIQVGAVKHAGSNALGDVLVKTAMPGMRSGRPKLCRYAQGGRIWISSTGIIP